jgi:hypothetical protein
MDRRGLLTLIRARRRELKELRQSLARTQRQIDDAVKALNSAYEQLDALEAATEGAEQVR